MNEFVDSLLFGKLSALIEKEMGIFFPKTRFKELERLLVQMTKELKFNTPIACIEWLLNEPKSREKTEILATYITNGETYFFRENSYFEAMEKIIIPEILENRRVESKCLQFWCAGCSSGEEAYSIAIMIYRMRHLMKGWEVRIAATDINLKALHKAVQGVYSEWSFRDAPEWLKSGYFTSSEKGKYTIIPEIRKMVEFKYLNLIDEGDFPLNSKDKGIDIILCRNVLMYFTPEKMRKTVEKFHRSLRMGGFLIVGSCETFNSSVSGFTPNYFKKGIFYKKTALNEIKNKKEIRYYQQVKTEKLEAEVEITKPKSLNFLEETIHKAQLYFEERNYAEAEVWVLNVLKIEEENLEGIKLLCQLCANEERLEEALQLSEKALEIEKLSPEIQYLQGIILMEMGKIEESMEALRKTIYLDNDFALAHFMLGNLILQKGQMGEAKEHFQHAIVALNRNDMEAEIFGSDGMQVKRLEEIIRRIMDSV